MAVVVVVVEVGEGEGRERKQGAVRSAICGGERKRESGFYP